LIAQSYVDDPAFVGLAEALQQYASCEVLRYREGKRITIAALDNRIGAVVVKYIAKGASEIVARLSAVERVKDELEFAVSRPVDFVPESNLFVQTRLAGEPVDVESSLISIPLVRAMAVAIRSLHESSALFNSRFDEVSQRARTERYLGLIKSKFPDVRQSIAAIQSKLAWLEEHIFRRRAELVPTHGSLHSHQWLNDDGRLVLVDFDRAAMGHPELDIATFLAEFDYEAPTIAAKVNPAFLSQFRGHDPQTLLFYRAHKHLSKVYKASRQAQPELARHKVHRNLGRTALLLADIRS
jgi:aminoglycoside phosphotransferase (APT) family kinase protein